MIEQGFELNNKIKLGLNSQSCKGRVTLWPVLCSRPIWMKLIYKKAWDFAIRIHTFLSCGTSNNHVTSG